MAKKSTPAETPPAPPAPHPRDRIIDALMALAALEDWEHISLPMIAERAGVSLADMRDTFPSKGAILGGFARRIDRIVLEGTSPDMMAEPTRERVLDVMLRRFEALAPYREALRNINRTLPRDPLTLAALNQVALNSWRYMLAAADVDTEDNLGAVKLQGAAVVFARAFETWLEDDDPALARTMAKLDRELQRGEQVMARLQDLDRLAAPFRGFLRAMGERRREAMANRRSRRDRDSDTDMAA